MNKVVEQLIKKELFKRGGVMASKEAVERAYRALAAKMEPLGLDITAIKSEADYNRVVGFVKSLEDQVFAKKFGDTLTKKESAEIFDLDKNKLNPNEPIIGGTQDEKEMLKKSIDRNVKQATEKGDFTGIANQVLRDPDIAREFMLSKKFPFRTAEGEEAIPLAMRAKFDEEMGIKSIPQRDDSFKQIIKDFRTFGKASDDEIQTITKSGKMAQIPYVMDNYGMSYREVIDTLKRGDPLIEGMASGGRAGFKVGSPSKRAFLKAAGGLAALITAIKSGLIGAPKKEVAKQVVKESAKDVANAPPQYFFDLAQTIKKFGKPDKVTYSDRIEIHRMVSKDGKSELQLTEDLSTGNIQIKKIKPEDDMVNEDIVLEYRKGDVDVDPEAGTAFKEADQYTEGREVTQRIYKDNYNEPDFYEGEGIDEIKKEIIKDTTEKKIKRAGGGVAYMLGE